jgi:YidC/Oxa1 family membrane protein insertase
MDNIRLFLWLTLFATLWLGYSAWVADYPAAVPPPASNNAAPSADAAAPDTTLPILDPTAAQTPPVPTAARPSGELVRVRTDVLDVLIDSQGGDLVRADLLQYPVDKRSPDKLVRLLDNSANDRWVFQTGLRSAVGGTEPNHLATFRSANNDYTLAAGQNELVVTLDWVGDGTLSARKTYTFRRGEYGVDLALAVQPAAGGSWRGAPYVQMTRVHHPPARSYFSVESYSFTGPVLYDGDQYDKLDVEDLAQTPITQTLRGGWLRPSSIISSPPPCHRPQMNFAMTPRCAGKNFY